MNLKNAVILLLFLMSILGLMVGIYYSEDISSSNHSKTSWHRVYDEDDGVLTVTLEKRESNEIIKYFT